MKSKKAHHISRILIITLGALLFSQGASAAIIFQDDDFHEIPSEALLLDSDGAGANNSSIQFGNDLTASENGNITWNITSNTFEFDHAVDITGNLTANGEIDFSGATRLRIREDADPGVNAICTTKGELIIDTTDNELQICTVVGSPGTWVAASSNLQGLESVYTTDGDGVLTTSNGAFGLALGSGEFDVTSTGLIDFNANSFDLDLTGVFTVDAVGASNVTTDSGSLTLSTTTSGNIALSGADNITLAAGNDILFNDAQLSAPINLTNTATGFNATLDGGGIIDNINQFTETTAGDGASNIGLETASLTNVSPASDDVQAALEALDAVVGAGAPNNEILSFYPEYPDTVIFKDGSKNKGKLEADYDDVNDESFYKWTSKKTATQDIDLRFRFSIPSDFTSINDLTFKYRTGTITEADNDVEIGIYNATDETAGNPTACATDATNGTAGTWATGTIAKAAIEAGCTGATALDAGDIIEIAIKLLDNVGAEDYADIGLLVLGYNN